MKELWKEVAKNTNYEVSNFGRVRRFAPGPGTYNGKILKIWLDKDGYPCARLSSENVVRFYKVHSLIASAWLGPRFRRKEVQHKDGNKLNNDPRNLEYVTRKQHKKKSIELGQVPRGSGSGMAK